MTVFCPFSVIDAMRADMQAVKPATYGGTARISPLDGALGTVRETGFMNSVHTAKASVSVHGGSVCANWKCDPLRDPLPLSHVCAMCRKDAMPRRVRDCGDPSAKRERKPGERKQAPFPTLSRLKPYMLQHLLHVQPTGGGVVARGCGW